jgi:Zn-finger protein
MTVVFDAVPLGGDHCDFCSCPSTFKTYTCTNFECCGRAVFRSPTGSWAACKTCSELVERKQWSRLIQRALYKFLAKHEVPREEIPTLWAQFAHVQQSFSEHLVYKS